MTVINTVWIGNKLGPIHAACLKSFVRTGHDVLLHAYSKPDDMPDGVRLFDANKLMKQSEIVSHKKTGSLALASDIYRYRILREGMGVYVDADMYSIKPMVDGEYVFGFEGDSYINGAVLKMPQDSTLLSDILEASENPYFIPPWAKQYKILYAQLRKIIGLPRHIATQSWGVIGPKLITYCVYKNNLEVETQPVDIFYPLTLSKVDKLFEPGLSVSNLITDNTVAIHLYNSAIQHRPIISNTPLYEIVTA